MDTGHVSQKRSILELYSLGFTIVELLIVIVVIAILASIIIVSYNGIQRSAIEASLKSDLENGTKTIEMSNVENGSYPTHSAANALLKPSLENQLTFTPTGSSYCLQASTARLGGISFYRVATSGNIQSGECPPAPATVATIAGSSTPGYQNGSGAAVRFNFYNALDDNYGVGIDTDSAGNAYVADHGNNTIRKVTPDGTVSTFVGIHGDNGNIANSNGLAASFNYPFDISIFTLQNEEMMLVSEKCLSLVNLTQASHPVSHVNDGSLAPHDSHYECPYLTNSGNTPQYAALYRDANSVVVASDNTVYLSEYDSLKVRKMTFNTSDQWWDEVTNLTPAGSFSYLARFGIDPQNRVYGSVGNKIVRFDTTGSINDVAGSTATGYTDAKGGSARFNDARGVDVDSSGNIYVADCGNHRVRRISPMGTVTTIAGSGTAGIQDGEGTAAQFNCPTDLAISSDGLTLYVVDTVTSGNDIAGYIRKLSF